MSPEIGGRANRRGGIPMSHSRAQIYIHCVCETTNRQNLIPTGLLEELWAYHVGIGRNKGIPLLAVGGIENHIHLLIELPPTKSLAEAINIFKSNSSRWIKDEWRQRFFVADRVWSFQHQPATVGRGKKIYPQSAGNITNTRHTKRNLSNC